MAQSYQTAGMCGTLHYRAGDPGTVRICIRPPGHPGYHSGPKAEPVHVSGGRDE